MTDHELNTKTHNFHINNYEKSNDLCNASHYMMLPLATNVQTQIHNLFLDSP